MKSNVSITKFPPPPQPIVPVVSLTLNLTERDARAMIRLCSIIGGSPDKSPRHVFNLIKQNLINAGFNDNGFSIQSNNSIYFSDYDSINFVN
jgi:hypothetical protein